MGIISDAIICGVLTSAVSALRDYANTPSQTDEDVDVFASEHFVNSPNDEVDHKDTGQESLVEDDLLQEMLLASSYVPIPSVDESLLDLVPVEEQPLFPSLDDAPPTEVDSTPILVKEDIPLPSFESIKVGIETALINARKAAGLDGSKNKHKVRLHEITRDAKFDLMCDANCPQGRRAKNEEKKAVELAKQNMEAFLREVAPHMDVSSTITMVLVSTGESGDSHVMLDRAAKAVLKDFDMQNKGLYPIFDSSANLLYISQDVDAFVVLQNQKRWGLCSRSVLP